MDSFKLKAADVLFEYEYLNEKEFRGLLIIIALNCTLGHLPTHKQMLKVTHHKTLKSIINKLSLKSTSIDDICISSSIS